MSGKNAFELLRLEQDAGLSQRYTKEQVIAAYAAARTALEAAGNATQPEYTELTQAQRTLIGWNPDGTQPLVTGSNPLQHLAAQGAQEYYVQALQQAGGDGGVLPDFDERNAWKSFGKMVRILEELPPHIRQNSAIKPLQIVVAGDENSGKSQAAQRIIGRELFAIKEGWCTKVPTKLTFHRSKHQHTITVALKGTKVDSGERFEREKGTVSLQRSAPFYRGMATVVNQWVDEIVAEHGRQPGTEDGFPIEGIFHIDIYAPDVPELILVDLPGLVGVPAGYKRQTAADTTRWLKDKNSIVVTVWPLEATSFRATTLGPIVAEQMATDPHTKRRHIGVITKSDFAAVLDYRNGFTPLRDLQDINATCNERLLARMDGSHADWTYGFKQYFAAGRTWIPMANKGPKHPDLCPAGDIAKETNLLRCTKLPRIEATRGDKICPGAQDGGDVPEYGIRALHHQIDTIVEEQLRTDWKQRTLVNLDAYLSDLLKHGKRVYTKAFKWGELYDAICVKVNEVANVGDSKSFVDQLVREDTAQALATCVESWNAAHTRCGGAPEPEPEPEPVMSAVFEMDATLPDGTVVEAGRFGQFGSNKLAAIKECSKLNETLAGQLTDGIIRGVLQKFADQIIKDVFGEKPDDYEQYLQYDPKHPPRGSTKDDEKKYWRYESEMARFKDAVHEQVGRHADAVRGMLVNLPLIVLQKVDRFELLLEDALLQVVSDCFASDDAIKGWYKARVAEAPGDLATELGIIVEARRRAEGEKEDIHKAKRDINQLFPDIAGGGGGGGGGAAGAGRATERPDVHLCPISREVMADPVSAADGHSYERASIAQWFARGNITSPMTGARLDNTNLTPNHALKSTIQEFLP